MCNVCKKALKRVKDEAGPNASQEVNIQYRLHTYFISDTETDRQIRLEHLGRSSNVTFTVTGLGIQAENCL